MSDWREDNFLERLTHSSPIPAGLGLCPEAEALHARASSEGIEAVADRLSQHIVGCPLCSDLYRRLEMFDQAGDLEADLSVIEVEKRLDSWLKGFLSSQSLSPQTESLPSAAAPKTTPLPFHPKRSLFWQLQWGLAAAAILVITFGVVYFRRSIIASTPAPMVARVAPAQPPPAPSEPQASPKPVPPDQARPVTVAPKSSQEPKRHKAVSPSSKGTPVAPHSEVAAAPKQGAQAAAQEAPPVDTESPAVADNHPAPPLSTPVHPTIPPAGASLSRGPIHFNSGAKTASGFTNGTTSSTPPPRPIAPSVVRIPAGTRIWISLESRTAQNDGRFQFEGRLLLPVYVSNSVVLEKGTSAAGVGSISLGQTSVQITEFMVNGNRYRLRAGSVAGVPQAVATGKAVQFESGKVLEMWLDSAVVFESAGAPSAGPQH